MIGLFLLIGIALGASDLHEAERYMYPRDNRAFKGYYYNGKRSKSLDETFLWNRHFDTLLSKISMMPFFTRYVVMN